MFIQWHTNSIATYHYHTLHYLSMSYEQQCDAVMCVIKQVVLQVAENSVQFSWAI